MSTSRLMYYLREAWLTLIQHRRLHATAIVMMSVAVSILALFLLLMLNANLILNQLGGQAKVIIFLDDRIQPAQRRAIEAILHDVAKADDVRYVSKAQAWEDFASWYPQSHQLLEGLGPESLPASLVMQLSASAQSDAALGALRQRLARLPGIEEVEYGAQWRASFRMLLRGVRFASWIGGGLLGLGMLIMMANTTRLALYSRLHDIEIMQLVGATERFISWPFLVTGMVQSLLGMLVGLGFLLGMYQTVLNPLNAWLSATLGFQALRFLPWSAIIGIAVGSLAVGYLGSAFTLNRMLRILRVTS